MNNGINSNYNNYLLDSTGIEKSQVQARLQSSKDAVVDNISSNSVAQTLGATNDNGMAQAAPLVPLLYVADKFIDSRMAGQQDKTLLAHVASLGDKISDTLHLEKFMSGAKVAKFKNFVNNNRFTKYFTDAYKAIPKSSMARTTTMAEQLTSKLDAEAQKVLSELVDVKYSTQALDQLKNAGTSAKTIQFLEKLGPLKERLTPDFLQKVTTSLDDVASIATQDTEVIKALKDNIAQFAAGKGNISEKGLSQQIASFFSQFADGKYQGKAVNLTQKANEVVSSISKDGATTSQILDAVDDIVDKGFSLKGQKNLSIAKNKLSAVTNKIGKTPLGKLLAKGTIKGKDVATYGGGIISLFFMASSLMNAIKATKEAPEGEKKATFMHVLSEQYLGMVLFQPSINLVYKVAGNKYRGMTVEGRKALADLVKNTNLDENLTKEGLKIAKMQQKLLLKGVDKDKVATLAGKGLKEAKNIARSLKHDGAKLKFWEKPLKAAGSVLGAGLDTLKKSKFINVAGKKIKLPHPTAKGFVGGFGRLMLIMMVVQPLLQKPLTKLCHKIFGKPKTYLAKQEAANATPPQPLTDPNLPTNLLDRYTLEQQAQNAAQPMQQVQPEQAGYMPNVQVDPNMLQNPSGATGLQDARQEGSYIPSIHVDYQDDAALLAEAKAQALLKSTDAYMKKVQSSLK